LKSSSTRESTAVITRGLENGDLVVTAGVHKLKPIRRCAHEMRARRWRQVTQFNLSEWALRHRALVRFLIIALAVIV